MSKHSETLAGHQHDVLGIAVRTMNDRENIRLLRSCRQSRAGSHARDVEDHDRNFGVIGKSDELVHQRNAGACRRCHGTCASPSCSNGHAHGGQFVFCLNDGEGRFAVRSDAVVAHIVGQCFHQTRRRRDRIPRGDRDSCKHAAQSRSGIAVDDDLAGGRIHPSASERNQLAIEIFLRKLSSSFQRLLVQRNGFGFALELLGQCRIQFRRIDLHQLAHDADIDHVGQQLSQAASPW